MLNTFRLLWYIYSASWVCLYFSLYDRRSLIWKYYSVDSPFLADFTVDIVGDEDRLEALTELAFMEN